MGDIGSIRILEASGEKGVVERPEKERDQSTFSWVGGAGVNGGEGRGSRRPVVRSCRLGGGVVVGLEYVGVVGVLLVVGLGGIEVGVVVAALMGEVTWLLGVFWENGRRWDRVRCWIERLTLEMLGDID